MICRERFSLPAVLLPILLSFLLATCAREAPEPTIVFRGPTPAGQGDVRVLPFATIDREDAPRSGDYRLTPQPTLVIMVAPEDSERLGNSVDEEARAQLLALDYDAYFAVAVFLGHFNSDRGQEVQVEQVLLRGNQLAIYARVPGSSELGKDIEISPYHIISIAKEGPWNQEIEFTLYLNGEAAVTETHFIP